MNFTHVIRWEKKQNFDVVMLLKVEFSSLWAGHWSINRIAFHFNFSIFLSILWRKSMKIWHVIHAVLLLVFSQESLFSLLKQWDLFYVPMTDGEIFSKQFKPPQQNFLKFVALYALYFDSIQFRIFNELLLTHFVF